jgi:hypothetical protein
MNTICTLGKHIERIKLNLRYISIGFLVHAILLYVTNLLVTFAIATIVLHKASLVRSKSSLAFLGVIAQSLFVERSSLAIQTYKQAVLTTISLG